MGNLQDIIGVVQQHWPLFTAGGLAIIGTASYFKREFPRIEEQQQRLYADMDAMSPESRAQVGKVLHDLQGPGNPKYRIDHLLEKYKL